MSLADSFYLVFFAIVQQKIAKICCVLAFVNWPYLLSNMTNRGLFLSPFSFGPDNSDIFLDFTFGGPLSSFLWDT